MYRLSRCVEICPTQALAQISERATLLHPELCTYCVACQDVCPENAISLPFLIVFGLPVAAAPLQPIKSE